MLFEDLTTEQIAAPLDTFTADSARTMWYAVCTAANREKRVADQFRERCVEHFLPTYESLRKWKDRRKMLDRPLFPGYLFVHIALCERIRVVQVPGVAYLVGFNGRPAAVDEKDIESIRLAIALRVRLAPHPYLTAGCRVRICRGPFEGAEGVMVRQSKSFRVVLSLSMIQSSVAVEVHAEDIEPLPANAN
jgi:transcription antitermination factor NusG